MLAPDLDRIAPSLEVGFKHLPAFQKAGIKQIINGPFTFAPMAIRLWDRSAGCGISGQPAA